MTRGTQAVRRLIEPNDTYVPKEAIRGEDIVIPVMGPIGVGKSTFINNVLVRLGSDSHAETSDGFASCTAKLSEYGVTLPSKVAEEHDIVATRRLVLVDTPGFDNATISDTEILRRIAVWLATAYDANVKLGGIVYIYPIYPGRITKTDYANIKIFQKICGIPGLSTVILATNRWDICPAGSGERRQKEVWDSFWKGVPEPPPTSTMLRIENTPESAWQVVSAILHRGQNGAVLAIQQQLIDKGKFFQQTDAAQALRAKIRELLDDTGVDPRVPGNRQRLDALAREAKDLKIPLSKRIQSIFGLHMCG